MRMYDEEAIYGEHISFFEKDGGLMDRCECFKFVEARHIQ